MRGKGNGEERRKEGKGKGERKSGGETRREESRRGA
jgi:hypothetical protein